MEFNKAYNRDELMKFLRVNFLPEDYVEKVETVILPKPFQYTRQVIRWGHCDSLGLVVYEVRHTSVNDARVGLTKEAFRMLADEFCERALVFFVPEDDKSNYRFSFIEITLDHTEGSARITRTYSNPHRYSYYLGEGIPYYTPNKYLNAAGRVVSIEDLRSRFSVEVLTKAFYQELSDWYAWAVKVVQFPNVLDDKNDNGQYNAEAMIRLITRLIFVWFIKQRHLVPDEFFDEAYISNNLLKSFTPNAKVTLFGKADNSYYYKGILQNLFFAMLNSPITPEGKDVISERRFRKGRGDYDNNKLMRHEDLFIDPNLFVELANRYVPFLNGGLFDCLDDKDHGKYYDAFTDREEIARQLIVPDYLFFGEDVGRGIDLSEWYGDKRKKKVSARGIIDILKRYNFTVEENTPFDQDVSLDPELLGKVFENLLASYNPETQTTARKQTGSFYTPREIVQYMVDESLVAHLKRTVGEELEPEYRKLVQYTDEELNLTEGQRTAIMQSIYNCKVLDPACGSGAFPMGMLQQMVHILNRIDPDNKMWKEMMLNNAISETSEAYRNATNEERSEIVADIERSFDESINRPDYARKLYLIENCIYGVDIQPVAIQISKLRFFISLVVDQKTNTDPIDNFGIRPLPNLEAKFVSANTLIGLHNQTNLFVTNDIEQMQDEMKVAKHKIFGAKTVKTKRKYKDRVAQLRKQMVEKLKQLHAVSEEDHLMLLDWDMFNQNKAAKFFDSEWMFGIDSGFDIVLANPPFGVIYSDKEKQYFLDNYRYQDYQPESYLFFIEKGISLTKNDGILSYIIPNTWLLNLTTIKIRKHIFETTSLIGIVHFNDYVFNAIVDTEIISLINRRPIHQEINVDIKTFKGDIIESSKIDQDVLIKKNGRPVSLCVKSTYLSLINKIAMFPRLDSCCKITQGTKPFQVGKGVPKQTKEDVAQKKYVSDIPKDGFQPLLRGSLMNRYTILWDSDYWIKYGIWLAEPRPSADYDAPEKIIIRQTGDSLIATLDSDQFIVRDNLYTCVGKSPDVILSTILGLLNSKLLNWYYQKVLNPEEGEALAQVKKGHLIQLPIAVVQNENLDRLVQERLGRDLKEETIVSLENEIDRHVYHLYGLTYDEVLIVDPDTPITREEYEKN